jgi:SOS-response transcriptional repressor LexA
MKTRRPITDSEKRAAQRLKNLYAQRKAQAKAAGGSLTYEDIVAFIDKTPGAVSQFMNGTTAMNEGMCLKMAKFFGVSPSEIDPELADMLPKDTGNVTSVGKMLNEHANVPLISWVQAGDCREVEFPHTANDAEKWILCPVPHSSQTFALRVEGLSMHNPGSSPSFEEGDIIHVDPEVRPENHSLVVVQVNGDTEATFKQLLTEGGEYFLKALNPGWPSQIIKMPTDASICGVVISKTVSYR